MTEALQIQTTTASREEAIALATALVQRRLAACVQIVGPLASVYRWQGAIEQAEEWLLLIKTTADAASRVMEAIRELHSYDVPEIVILPIVAGSPDYLHWLREEIQ